jgi:hypothetical protein
MFDDISFDTTNDKLKWGGIFATLGVALGVSCVMLRCMCRRCCGRRGKREPIVKVLHAPRTVGGEASDVLNTVERHITPEWEPKYAAVDMSTNTDWCHREKVVYPNRNKVDMATNTDVGTPPPYAGCRV